MRKSIQLIISTFILFNTISAQNLDSVLLKDIIIKENRLQVPFSEVSRNIEIITRKQIEGLPSRNIAELLSYCSGVDIRQRGVGGVQADANIRGGTFDQTLVLLDGFPLADPQSGHHSLNLPIDIQNIERIEILKGSGARIYGQNAFAGVINIVSRKVSTEGGASFSANYGELATLALKAGVSIPSQNMPVRLSYSRQSSEGYRKNTDYSIDNYFVQSQLNVLNQKIDLMAGHTDRKFGGSGFYAGPASNKFAALFVDNTTDEYETIKTSFASANTTFKTDKIRITPRFYWRKNADDYYFVRNTPIFNSTTSDVFGGEIQSSYESKLGTTGVGLSLQKTKFRSLKLDTTNRTQSAIFVEHRFHFLDEKLDITPGVMYSKFSDFGGDFFPGIDVGYRFNDNIKMYSTWGKTFRIPTFTDLYFNNSSNLSNPYLVPEKAQNFEIGVRYTQSALRVNAAWFIRNGTDIIDRIKTDTTAGVKWLPTNLTDLKVSGIDASIEYLPAILRGGNYWLQRVSFSVTYLSKIVNKQPAEVKASRYAADQLKYQANLSIQSKIVGNLSQSLNVRYFERLTLPKGFEEYYKGFLTDWRLMWSETNYQLYLQVNNLFNKKYVESNGITMPRRWMSIGIDTQFGKY